MSYKVVELRIEITETENPGFTDIKEEVFRILNTTIDKKSRVTIVRKNEEITVNYTVTNRVLYVFDIDDEEYRSSNNELYKSIFGDCKTYHINKLSNRLSEIPVDRD